MKSEGGASNDCEDDTHARFVEPFEPKPHPRRHIRAAIGDLSFPLLLVSHLLANVRLVAPPTPPPVRTVRRFRSKDVDRSPANQVSVPPNRLTKTYRIPLPGCTSHPTKAPWFLIGCGGPGVLIGQLGPA